MSSMDRRQSQQPQFISSYNKHCKERINLCCMLTNHCTKSACKCSQRALMFVWMTAESRGQEVVRCSQHSKIFVWVRHCLMCFCYCLLNVWWETRQKKQDGTESNSKSCGPLSPKKWQVFVVKETWYPWDTQKTLSEQSDLWENVCYTLLNT